MTCNWQAMGSNFRPWIDTVPPIYNKPIQGSYPDCLFIAALNSLGWVAYDFIRNDTTYHTWTDPTVITFWYSPTQGTNFSSSVKVAVNSRLSADSNALLCGATSANSLETWVGIYEKAYAKFRQWLIMSNLTPFPATSYTWDPAKVGDSTQEPADPGSMSREHWGGNPMVTTAHLVGGVTHSRDVKSTVIYGKCGGNNTDIYTIIKKCLCYNSAGKTGGKTNLPITAWTLLNGPFTGTGLTPQHSYSVLGWWESGGEQYLILRDTKVVDPQGTAIFTNGAMDYGEKEFDLPHYSISGSGLRGLIETSGSLPLSWSDGVFGIKQGLFTQYFQTVGWVNKT
jgi:hypothetical protein